MGEVMISVVETLIKMKKTVATMESCTGGAVVNAITNIPGASEILKYSAVTYSNEYKIKMGVSEDIIDEYSVYSIQVAMDMSKKISEYANSDYGIGVTGKINRADKDNPYGKDNMIYVSIYDRENDKCMTMSVEAVNASREANKLNIVRNIAIQFEQILNIVR